MSDASEDKIVKIAVGINSNQWHSRMLDALEVVAKTTSSNILYQAVNIDADDWLSMLEPFDVVLWKPKSMGFEAASYFKEKIYFLEKFMGKLVVPNFDTIWHFDSKVAQEYIFRRLKISSPRTVVSFDYDDALTQLDTFPMPLVFKRPEGAGSSNVRMISDRATAIAEIKKIFCKQLVDREIAAKGKIIGKLSGNYLQLRRDRKRRATNHPVVYWQEFIPGNARDLRVTVIGDTYAFGFWRNNRKDDFRASGSGDIDYLTPVPESVVRYCLALNKIMNFDSMAYDIIFREGQPIIVEMSYGYVDVAVRKAPGYFELVDDSLHFRHGHTWPQALWVRWAIHRCRLGEPHAINGTLIA